MEDYGDIGAGGDDEHGVALGVSEGGVTEEGGEAHPPLAPRHVGMHHVHHHRRPLPLLLLRIVAAVRGRRHEANVSEVVLEEGFFVLRLKSLPFLVPHDHRRPSLLHRRRIAVCPLRHRAPTKPLLLNDNVVYKKDSTGPPRSNRTGSRIQREPNDQKRSDRVRSNHTFLAWFASKEGFAASAISKSMQKRNLAFLDLASLSPFPRYTLAASRLLLSAVKDPQVIVANPNAPFAFPCSMQYEWLRSLGNHSKNLQRFK